MTETYDQKSELQNKLNYTLKKIQNIRDAEIVMYKNLQELNDSDIDGKDEITQRLTALKDTRMALLTKLSTMYTDQQTLTSNNRNNLADQITMYKMVDHELDNAKDKLKALQQDKLNKERLVKLGEYEYDRYTSHKNILKIVAYGALGVLIMVGLMTQPWFPASAGFLGISIIIGAVIIMIGLRVLNNLRRTDYNWQKFEFQKGCIPDADGKCIPTVGGRGNLKQFELANIMPSCNDVSAAYDKTKYEIENIGNALNTKANMSLTDPSSAISQGFVGSMVYPSQPKGYKSFHTIF